MPILAQIRCSGENQMPILAENHCSGENQMPILAQIRFSGESVRQPFVLLTVTVNMIK